MAQRFGGKFSPDGASGGPDDRSRDERPAYHGARVAPAGARSNVLFIPGIILAILSINDGAVGREDGHGKERLQDLETELRLVVELVRLGNPVVGVQ